jgi:hypothetical protein
MHVFESARRQAPDEDTRDGASLLLEEEASPPDQEAVRMNLRGSFRVEAVASVIVPRLETQLEWKSGSRAIRS